ncbi:MAG TPA: cell wall-binding repeat-containing protein [Egibacteraceae bacterium]|nr:cell wall-binding repeat-containing protein [Egibacteraceae bacterium]
METTISSQRVLVGRALALFGALALAFALLAVPAAAQQGDGDDVTPARVDGQNRVETAVNIATLTFDRADVAHLVFGGDYPDALAASYAAGVVDGPILMPASRDDVGAITWDALEELGVERVRLVGGEAVLSPAIQEQLDARGYENRRIAGTDRYATSAEVAKFYGLGMGDNLGTVDGHRTAVMASGANFPDALAVGPIAAAAQLPLVLTPPHRADAEVDHALDLLHIDRIVLVGGTAAVSPAVERHYRDLGFAVERVAGAHRMGTAALLADRAVLQFGFSPALVLLARGDDFPDALAASIHGATAGAPILLTQSPAVLGQPTSTWLARSCPDIDVVRALGGDAAIRPATLRAAVEAARSCRQPVGSSGLAERQAVGDFTDLVDVHASAHTGFDRIVLEFAGAEHPAWPVRWTDEPRYQPADQPAEGSRAMPSRGERERE